MSGGPLGNSVSFSNIFSIPAGKKLKSTFAFVGPFTCHVCGMPRGQNPTSPGPNKDFWTSRQFPQFQLLLKINIIPVDISFSLVFVDTFPAYSSTSIIPWIVSGLIFQLQNSFIG
jgi:hypothetical protein